MPPSVLCRGFAAFKTDSPFATWNKRYLILRDDQLSWHRNESTMAPMGVLNIADIKEINRSDAKTHCFCIVSACFTFVLLLHAHVFLCIIVRSGSQFLANMKSDNELFDWLDALQQVRHS